MNTLNNDCSICETCEDTLKGIDYKLISIVDKLLYNTRFELNRVVDRNLFKLLSFYKEVLEDICDDEDCGCYYTPLQSCVSVEIPNTGDPTAVVNHCICGCCPPLNVVCGFKPTVNTPSTSTTSLTKENIIERIKILTA